MIGQVAPLADVSGLIDSIGRVQILLTSHMAIVIGRPHIFNHKNPVSQKIEFMLLCYIHYIHYNIYYIHYINYLCYYVIIGDSIGRT